MAVRYPDWTARWARALAARRRGAFAWGVRDCVTFTGEMAEALTGSNPLAFVRGRYADEAEAWTLLESLGGAERMLTGALGTPVPAPLACRGDVVLVAMREGAWATAFAVCDGEYAVSVGARGLVRVPMTSALKAWRV